MKKRISGVTATSKSRSKNCTIGANKKIKPEPTDTNNRLMRLELQLVQPITSEQMGKIITGLERKYPDDFIIMIAVGKDTINDGEPDIGLATSDMPPETRDFILAYAQRRLNQTQGGGHE